MRPTDIITFTILHVTDSSCKPVGVKSRDLAVEIIDNRLRVVFTKDGEVVSKRFFRLDEEEVVVAGISAKLARGELTLTVPKIPKVPYHRPLKPPVRPTVPFLVCSAAQPFYYASHHICPC